METRILIFEHSGDAGWAATLKAQLAVAMPESLLLLHERHRSMGADDSAALLAAAMKSSLPHLLLLLLPPEGKRDLEALLTVANRLNFAPPVVVVTDATEPCFIQNMFDLGVSDILVPPLRPFEIWPRLRRFLRGPQEQSKAVVQLKDSLGLQQLFGESPLLIEQIRKIPMFARCNASVLITGENGTGKELCARAIHYLSPRSDQPFVPLNSGAIPIELAENELFGHEAGAFTNAHSAQPGAIREAEGGTLFWMKSMRCR